MPRMGRAMLPSYPHHVVQRGHNRQVIFAETRDYCARGCDKTKHTGYVLRLLD